MLQLLFTAHRLLHFWLIRRLEDIERFSRFSGVRLGTISARVQVFYAAGMPFRVLLALSVGGSQLLVLSE